MGGILGIFSPASASIERTNIVGFLLLDFHTANIACASNHESARGGGGRFFSWVLNLKRFVSNKCGWAKGGLGSVFMHSVYDATYLYWPACSILQSFFLSTFGMCIWGVAAKGESLQGLIWQNTAYVGPTLCI